MKKLRVLIACEESQRVCTAFRELGHEAYSCDIQVPSGGHPEWHILGDALKVLNPQEIFIRRSYDCWYEDAIRFETIDKKEHIVPKWDMIIAHPPCTYLTVTGNRWFNVEKYGDKATQRAKDREEAVSFFMEFANANCEHIAIENPVGVMSSYYRKPNQIIQPWMFGDAAEKKTCLWLKGLPNLTETKVTVPPERVKFDSGKSMPKWYADAWHLSKEERSRVRSKTFPGIAKAMAEQWGNYLSELSENT